jgi:hypothetical protein
MRALSERVAVATAGLMLAGAIVGACSSSSTSPLPNVLVYAGGSTTAQITGSYSQALAAPLISGRLIEGVGVRLQFSTVQLGSVMYDGPATPGTYTTKRTDTSLVQLGIELVLSSSGNETDAFTSVNGECSITITQMDRKGGSGSYACTDMPSTKTAAKINAQGTFTVNAPPQ